MAIVHLSFSFQNYKYESDDQEISGVSDVTRIGKYGEGDEACPVRSY